MTIPLWLMELCHTLNEANVNPEYADAGCATSSDEYCTRIQTQRMPLDSWFLHSVDIYLVHSVELSHLLVYSQHTQFSAVVPYAADSCNRF
jgi:hypothetical protein